MEYLHVKSLEKYHPKYKDRELIWCKAYFTMLNADDEFEMLCEIDKWRFLAFVMLELQLKHPVPLNKEYLQRKGFDCKKRPMSLTLKMLHSFVSICVLEVDKEVEEEIDKEIDKEGKSVTEFFDYFCEKTKKHYSLTQQRKQIIRKRLRDGFSIEQLKKAVDNFIQDPWDGRTGFIDIVYCIGIRNKIDNLEKWLNWKPQKEKRYGVV